MSNANRNNTPALAKKNVDMELQFESYITGLTDGEGSFLISFNQRNGLNTKIEVRPSFSLTQHKRNYEILNKIRKYFQCGSIRFSKRDQCYKYEVRNLLEIIKYVIPHFMRYKLQTTKNQDFELFTQICMKMKQNHHRSNIHLKAIIESAFQMNPSGKRKYSKNDLLNLLAS